jgi:hypothetical protein
MAEAESENEVGAGRQNNYRIDFEAKPIYGLVNGHNQYTQHQLWPFRPPIKRQISINIERDLRCHNLLKNSHVSVALQRGESKAKIHT